uniref:C2H2-type domain-containing protein n=1 Tax=Tetranychus urticae TaxID=32264 RepID=T1K0B3_TETUR
MSGVYSMSVKSIDSGVGYCSAASRSNTPSPTTINEDSTAPIAIEIKGDKRFNGLTIKDEGIYMDETIDFTNDYPIQTSVEKARRIVFKCTWRGCGLRCDLVEDIEKHVRIVHLGRSEATGEDDNDHEEEFYYAEIEEEMEIDNISSKESSCSSDSSLGPLSPVSSSPESPNSTNYNLSPTLSSASLLFFAPSPTWSHLDMARPPHEDPEYQKQQKQLQQQQQLQQNQQVQNVQQTTSVNQTILSAQIKPEPERKTVISSPINIPGISVAHRWSTKGRDSSCSSSSFSTSCNSSYSSFSNSHSNQQHHNHHHHNHPFNPHHEHQSQASFLASGSSPLSFFSPKAPSKVMRLSCKTSSPVNLKSTSSSPASTANATTPTPSIAVGNGTTTNSSTMSTNFKNASNSSNHHHHQHHSSNSNQWTSLLQSSSSSSSSPSKGHSISPTRRSRTETRKCRKVYGMDNRDSWCTQCKWKKACTRFVD